MKCDLKAFINVHIRHTKKETEQQSVDEVYGNNNLNHRQKEAPSRPSTNGVRYTETVSSAG